MTLEIVPYQGVGELKFGMTREHTRALLPEPAFPFRKSRYALLDTDAYRTTGVHIYFKYPEDVCQAIELWRPADPLLGDEAILHVPFQTLRKRFERDDSELIIRGEGEFVSPGFGLAVWTPDVGQDEFPRSVLVFERGYYEQVDAESLEKVGAANAMVNAMLEALDTPTRNEYLEEKFGKNWRELLKDGKLGK